MGCLCCPFTLSGSITTRQCAATTRFAVGDRVAVGLTALRVLPNFALASERGGKIIDA